MAHEELRHRLNLLENKILQGTRLRGVSVPGVATRKTIGSPRSAQGNTDNAARGTAVVEPCDRQASHCDWPRRTGIGSAAVAEPPQSEPEPPQSDPERTGPRCAVDSSSSTASLRVKEELLRIVKQMELHREQIQVHQRQLSTLEQQHAELIAALPGATATDDNLFDEQIQAMQNASGPRGASAVDTIVDETEQVNERLAALTGFNFVDEAATAQLEAAEARLGLQGVVQRSRSASSGRKAHRPGSASSTLSGPAVLGLQGASNDDAMRLNSLQQPRSLVDIQELVGMADFAEAKRLAEASAKAGDCGERPGSGVLPWKRLFKAHWEPR